MDSILLPDDDEPVDLDGLVHPPSWHSQAACADAEDPDAFYSSSKGDGAAALAVCASCPVRFECLQQALTTPQREDWGIWGGLTKQQRRALRRERDDKAA